jgi:hypothetical protein
VSRPAPSVVALVPDLMDRSRVSAAVAGVRFVAGADALAAALAAAAPGAVALVDLGRPGALEAGRRLVTAGTRVVGFAAHVDDALLRAAAEAGIEALPRSRAFRSLPSLLAPPPSLPEPPPPRGDPVMDASPPLIPLEDLFGNPERAGAQISPDGTMLGYLAPEAGRLNVWVRPLGAGDGDGTCVTHDHVRGISSWVWSRDSTRILYVQDQGGNEDFHLHVADLDRPSEVRATSRPSTASGSRSSTRPTPTRRPCSSP